MPAPLIPYGTPLVRGTTVTLRVELLFDVLVDDWMDNDEEEITIDVLQNAIGKWESDRVAAALRGDLGDRETGDVDWTVTVPDTYLRELGNPAATRTLRVENEYEYRGRIAGTWCIANTFVGLDGNPS